MSKAIKLYRHPLSGHCHRVELFMSLLDLPCELIDVDLINAEHKQPEFLSKNIFGAVPVIDDDGIIVSDSNAILVYLAKKYDSKGSWLPGDPVAAAEVQRFLSVAQGPVAYGPAAARLVNVFGADLDHEVARQRSDELLETLDKHLAGQDYLAGAPSIADIACYTYIAHAPEGGVSLQPYPNVRTWLERIQSMPKFIPMQATAIGLAA